MSTRHIIHIICKKLRLSTSTKLSGLDVNSLRKSTRSISTVTAWPKDSGFGPEYWVENIVSNVHFSDAILKYVHLEQGFGQPIHGPRKADHDRDRTTFHATRIHTPNRESEHWCL